MNTITERTLTICDLKLLNLSVSLQSYYYFDKLVLCSPQLPINYGIQKALIYFVKSFRYEDKLNYSKIILSN